VVKAQGARRLTAGPDRQKEAVTLCTQAEKKKKKQLHRAHATTSQRTGRKPGADAVVVDSLQWGNTSMG
jgi:hypothetical protein